MHTQLFLLHSRVCVCVCVFLLGEEGRLVFRNKVSGGSGCPGAQFHQLAPDSSTLRAQNICCFCKRPKLGSQLPAWCLTTISKSSPSDWSTLRAPLAPGMHVMYIHADKTLLHIQKSETDQHHLSFTTCTINLSYLPSTYHLSSVVSLCIIQLLASSRYLAII